MAIPNISSKSLAAGDLNHITIPNPRDLNGGTVSTIVQSPIWSGTLRTLRRPDTYISQEIRRKSRLTSMSSSSRKELFSSPPGNASDIEFFTWLLGDRELRDAIMKRLPPPRG
jgi:hypothetical protein